jgi:hypothetical protein
MAGENNIRKFQNQTLPGMLQNMSQNRARGVGAHRTGSGNYMHVTRGNMLQTNSPWLRNRVAAIASRPTTPSFSNAGEFKRKGSFSRAKRGR